MAGTLLSFFFSWPYSKPSDQATKEGAGTLAEAVHGGCAVRARRGKQGLRAAPGGFIQPNGWGSWPCFSTATPPMRSGYGGGNMAIDGFQMGYQVCPQSTLRLLWSWHFPQLWFSCLAKACSGMPVKPNPPLPSLLLPPFCYQGQRMHFFCPFSSGTQTSQK